MEARTADSEPLMTEREIPSWLKYYEEEQLSAGQVRWAAVYETTLGYRCCAVAHALLIFLAEFLQKKQQQKVEKASRKSRKRKTASYKEEEISHSSDLDSSTDEEAAVNFVLVWNILYSHDPECDRHSPESLLSVLVAAGVQVKRKGRSRWAEEARRRRRGRFRRRGGRRRG